MLEIGIMIEGQNGLNWPRWQKIARAVEDLGIVGLFRSNHFTNSQPPDLDSLQGRQPTDVRRSLMTGCIFGENSLLLNRKISERTKGKRTIEQLRQRSLLVGTPSEIVEQLDQFSSVSLQRIMLQWLDPDDLDGLKALAKNLFA